MDGEASMDGNITDQDLKAREQKSRKQSTNKQNRRKKKIEDACKGGEGKNER